MMSGLARLRLGYEGAGYALPGSLVAKFPSANATNREVAMSYNLYEREVRYFAELDPLTSAYTPRTLVCELDGDNFLILMEDLGDYRVGDQAVGADLAETELMLDELAKLHAAFWDRVGSLAWVPHVSGSYHADNMARLIRIGWPNMAERFADSLAPEIACRGEDLIAAVPELQRAMDSAPVTLLHGDFRMENVLFGTRAQHRPVAIIDWQGPLLGKSMVDVALILGQSTRTDVRRAHERALVQRYAERLAEQGVCAYGPDRAWQDYEMALLYNWIYTAVVSGTLDASDARAFAWMSQMVARQSVATLDLDLLRLLP
jgi:aminoglycoside/choline kinase family phosphotransferase